MVQVFQIDSPLVKSHYDRSENYRVEYDESGNRNVCAIYFSSHNIYFPNTPEAFSRSIVVRDHYEWYRSRVRAAYKHIFVRDIHKQWYISGINSRCDSIDSLTELLRHLTEGYRTIWVGSSAGGYAAALFGNLLEGERIYTFNGQMEIESLVRKSSPEVDPLVFRHAQDPKKARFYSLRHHIYYPERTFYFCSLKSRWDAEQLEHIQDTRIHVLKFASRKHGLPFLKSSALDVIQLGPDKLVRFGRRVNHPLLFSISVSGGPSTAKGLMDLGLKGQKLLIQKLLRARR